MEKKMMFSAKNISKSFYGTQALKGVDLDIYEGEVVGLIGENGAGKSTLLKIIIGLQPPSGGTMTMNGQDYSPHSPRQANQHGVGMVFQEQSLITTLTVGQNIFFGLESTFRRFGLVNWKAMYAKAQAALDEVGVGNISPGKKVSDLNFATRQMVEIAKVVNVSKTSNSEHCLILLDEPTSVLNETEVQRLNTEIRKLTKAGHSVIFVSHRLDEVLEISDRVYVFKDGENAGDMAVAEADESRLYEMMVGRTTTMEYYQLDQQRTPEEDIVLETNDLGLWGLFKHVDLKLHRGEILGICGVVGSGKEDLCAVLCGDEKPTSGSFTVRGKDARFHSCYDALCKGIIHIPKERLSEGIVGTMSVEKNTILSCTRQLRRGPYLPAKGARKMTDDWIKKLRIKTPGPKELLIQLSGGNQQKVVFARALASESEVLILNHPTRGVDVGAKEEIYTLVREIVAAGKSVILLGDTLDECISMSNRVLVMRDGAITGEFSAPVEAKPSQVDIVSLMM